MEQTKKDKYGAEVCSCGGELSLSGAWRYNGRLYTNKFAFRCSDCFTGWCCSAEETETWQDVQEIKQLEKKIEAIKEKIIKRNS